ncbi:DUF2946 family protein [Herbaspirillum sp. VT-16-41]|uniref:DUF2946 family protein n=1 Tax=Herbaspirillum sp. VT-16-41 TaxID=1953765 RepID=UPI000981ADE6|nr:DUF2946 family protein [Herbaspirillum sp. VT-16-41]ONN66815.1 hypothetical protein BTM36_09760 [Herbaspirillum sp. VT-16-41]
MSSRPSPLTASAASRRPWLAAWACLSLVLTMVAAPWWQQAMARTAREAPAMAICSVGGNTGNGPAHLAASHCPLCCGSQHAATTPTAAFHADAVPGISYPLALLASTGRSASPTSLTPQARAPPA